jgi:hypothetical protein
MAAAAHPAGARGLAGLTSAVQNQLAVREFGRREKSERDLGMRLSSMLDQPTGEEIPDPTSLAPLAAQREQAETPEGTVPITRPTRQQRLSDVLGRGQAGLVRSLAESGYSRDAAALLGSQIAPRPLTPAWHQVTNYDPATKQNVTTWVDLNKNPNVVGRSKPQETLEDFERIIRNRGQQAPAPTAPSEPIPEPPPGPPPEPPPYGSAPTVAPPAAGGTQQRPTPRVSYHRTASGEITANVSEGEFGFEKTTIRGPGGVNYQVLFRKDPVSGQLVGDPISLGEAPLNEKDTEYRRLARLFKPNPGEPEYETLLGEIANLPTDQIDRGVKMNDLYRRYGRRTAELGPPPSPQMGAAAPQQRPPSYSPTQAGVTVTAPPATGQVSAPDDVALQRESAAIRAQQAAAQAGQVRSATQSAENAFPPGPSVGVQYLDRNWQAPPTGMSTTQIQQSGRYVQVAGQMLPALRQANGVKTMFEEMDKIIAKRPDLFPIKTGQKAKDAYNLGKANLYWNTPGVSNYDADVARLTALRVELPNVIKAFGDAANVAVAERSMTEAGVGIGPAMQDAAQARIDMLRKLMSSNLETAGLPALPGRPARAATMDDFARARREAKGDPGKTLQILIDAGINPNLEVQGKK